MKAFNFPSWAAAFTLFATASTSAQTKITLIGDSTVATYSSGNKQGWGSQLQQFFDSKKAKVTNLARGGASSKSFYQRDEWDRALNSSANYLFIQFGHNDESMSDYRNYLRRMINDSRKKGMTPVLVTPMRRVRFKNGKSTNDLADHEKEMKKVASELGVTVLNLNSRSGSQYNSWGEKKTLTYFADRTHPNSNGAKAIAALVASEIDEEISALRSALKDSSGGNDNPSPPITDNPPPPSSGGDSSNYDPKKDKAYEGYKYRPGQGYSVGKFKLPPKPSCIREVKSTITVNGTLDGKGCLYTFKGTAKGKSYKELCFAPQEISEGLPPMFKLNPGASIKNLQIECALDGIHTTRNNTIDNVFFRDVEEDAITINENVTVKNSQFWFCNDKCIQMNRANKAEIENNRFYYTSSAVLANYGRNVEVRNNYFYNTKRAIRSRTSNSSVVAENNSHDGGDCHLMAQDKGLLEDWGPGKLSGVKQKHCTENGGRIVQK